MKRLIVNADDFGYTHGVNAGIIRAHRQGIVTSATIMANGNAFADAVALAKENPDLGIGCHLVLVGGESVLQAREIPSLADAEGNLPRSLGIFLTKFAVGAIRTEDIGRELRAQAEKALAAGIRLTHFDSHKHTHLHPKVMEQVGKLAAELRIRRVRSPFEDFRSLARMSISEGPKEWKQRAFAFAAWKNRRAFERVTRADGLLSPEHFFGVTTTGTLNRRKTLDMIRSLPEGTSELMCHPGQYDSELESANTRLKRSRETELDALTWGEARETVSREGIELIHFGALE